MRNNRIINQIKKGELWHFGGGVLRRQRINVLKILMTRYVLIIVWQNRIFKAQLVGPKPW